MRCKVPSELVDTVWGEGLSGWPLGWFLAHGEGGLCEPEVGGLVMRPAAGVGGDRVEGTW